MSAVTALAIFAAGLVAGTVNTIVGSGSLITFPTLLAVGYPPVLANVSNTVGLLPGVVSGTIGYRRELEGQRRRAVLLGLVGMAGGVTGAVLLLVLPGSDFRRAVPVLILVACGLVAAQPRLNRLLAARRTKASAHGGAGLFLGVFATAVYGGYFGAAFGVILIALLAIFLPDDLQHLNAVKNVLALVVNGVAGLVFVSITHVAWAAAGLLAAGAVPGGALGAVIGRRLDPGLFRVVILLVGTAVAIVLLVS